MIDISPKFVSECSVENNRGLIQVMAWSRTGGETIFEPMMFTDAYTGSLVLDALNHNNNTEVAMCNQDNKNTNVVSRRGVCWGSFD